MVYQYTRPRGPIGAMFRSPGPCYGLPGLIGQSEHDPRSVHFKGPAFSFGTKHGKFKDECSPGPSFWPAKKVYRTGVDGTPRFSMYSRPKSDGASFMTPGPAAYSPEKAGPSSHYHHPAYRFGSKQEMGKVFVTPGKFGRKGFMRTGTSFCQLIEGQLKTLFRRPRWSKKQRPPCIYVLISREQITANHMCTAAVNIEKQKKIVHWQNISFSTELESRWV